MSDIKFFPEDVTLVIGVSPELVAIDKVSQDAIHRNLNQKSEFHVTIIGSQTGEEILLAMQNLDPQEKNKVVESIEALAKQYAWEILFKPDFYYLKKQYEKIDAEGNAYIETRQSIIQIAECEDLEPFYQQFNALMGTQFELPFLHTTLYTTSTDDTKRLRGIGIYSESDFTSLNPQKLDV